MIRFVFGTFSMLLPILVGFGKFFSHGFTHRNGYLWGQVSIFPETFAFRSSQAEFAFKKFQILSSYTIDIVLGKY